jgi:hypothetical protein
MDAKQIIRGNYYVCLRSNKTTSVVKGKVYQYDGDQLIHRNQRGVTMVLNGYNTLRQPGDFAPATEEQIKVQNEREETDEWHGTQHRR